MRRVILLLCLFVTPTVLAAADDKTERVWIRQNGARTEVLTLTGTSGDLYYLVQEVPLRSGDKAVQRTIARRQ